MSLVRSPWGSMTVAPIGDPASARHEVEQERALARSRRAEHREVAGEGVGRAGRAGDRGSPRATRPRPSRQTPVARRRAGARGRTRPGRRTRRAGTRAARAPSPRAAPWPPSIARAAPDLPADRLGAVVELGGEVDEAPQQRLGGRGLRCPRPRAPAPTSKPTTPRRLRASASRSAGVSRSGRRGPRSRGRAEQDGVDDRPPDERSNRPGSRPSVGADLRAARPSGGTGRTRRSAGGPRHRRARLERRGERAEDARLGSRRPRAGASLPDLEAPDRDRGRRPVDDRRRPRSRSPGTGRRRCACAIAATWRLVSISQASSPSRQTTRSSMPRPADAPGIEAATRARVERPDELDREPRVGVGPRRRRDRRGARAPAPTPGRTRAGAATGTRRTTSIASHAAPRSRRRATGKSGAIARQRPGQIDDHRRRTGEHGEHRIDGLRPDVRARSGGAARSCCRSARRSRAAGPPRPSRPCCTASAGSRWP